MKFKYDFLTQTDIGKLFGVSSHKIGEWLQDADLRTEEKEPSDKAIAGKYVAIFPCRNERESHSWNTQKTVDELVKAGHKLIPNPPEYLLLEHTKICGPYDCVKNSNNGYDILSSTGEIAVTAYGKDNAKIVADSLNAYDRYMKKKAMEGTP